MTHFKKGFTIIEILVVLAIIGFLVAVVLPSLSTMRSNQVLKSAATDIFSALNKARSNTLSSVDSSEYGVHFESAKIVIFKGTTFSSADPSNEEILISSPASVSGISLSGGGAELYFNRLSGAPNKTGTITVTNGSLSKVVTISATGAVSLN